MAEQPQGCARLTGSVAADARESRSEEQPPSRREPIMSVRVGQKAPEFTAPAYYQGGFTTVTLGDFSGKWVLLCFYPGDFTFV
jgi:hypothetical protein